MRVAAMDLGSNSFHLLVADVHPDGHIDPLVQEKEMLRLGDVVSRRGALTPTAVEQAVATVRRFRLLADAAGAGEILAKATSAIRRASNGGEVVDRIRVETGVHVEVISGQEEARLIFGAIRASVVLDPAPALCFDLGGGSLEVMVGDASSLMWATSVPLGVARLSAEYVHADPISKSDRRALRDRIEEILRPVVAEVATFEPKLAVGSSGTLECLAEMVAARRDEDAPATLNQLTITRQEFLDLHKELLASKAADRLRMDGLDARRVDLIVAGSQVLAAAMERFDFDQLTISRVGTARRDRARRGRTPRSRSTGPTTRTPSAGARCGGWPVAATGWNLTPGRWRSSRSTCSMPRLRCTTSATPTASCSSSPRSCTTSASTSPAAAITNTALTSYGTDSCAASRPTKSSSSRRSCVGTGAASPE